MKRILITGSRAWNKPEVIRNALPNYISQEDDEQFTVIHGGAVGADTMAAHYASELNERVALVFVEEHLVFRKWSRT